MTGINCECTSESDPDDLVGTEIDLSPFLRTLPVGLLLEDSDREIVAVNPALCDLLNVRAEPSELIGRDCARVAAEVKDRFDDADQFADRIETILDRRESVFDERLRLADDRTLERTYVPATLPGLPDERANLWLYRDVTDRDRRERTLERKTERLESFISVVSHDLRNPLNVASAELEAVSEEDDSERLDAAAAALERMESLIDDLFVLAREGDAIGDREPVTLEEVVQTSWSYVETAEATLETDGDLDRTVRADRSRLIQLFENLFRNAVEHGSTTPPSRGPGDAIEHGDRDVRITVGTVRNGFYVADDGPGIPPERRNRVFDSGYSTSENGSGLGLRITETIVDAHGWEIDVGEAAYGGARFEITGVRFLD